MFTWRHTHACSFEVDKMVVAQELINTMKGQADLRSYNEILLGKEEEWALRYNQHFGWVSETLWCQRHKGILLGGEMGRGGNARTGTMLVVVGCICQCFSTLSWTLKIAVFILSYSSKKMMGKDFWKKKKPTMQLHWNGMSHTFYVLQ